MEGRLQIQGEKALTQYNRNLKGQKVLAHRGMAATAVGIGKNHN